MNIDYEAVDIYGVYILKAFFASSITLKKKPKILPKTSRRAEQQVSKLKESNPSLTASRMAPCPVPVPFIWKYWASWWWKNSKRASNGNSEKWDLKRMPQGILLVNFANSIIGLQKSPTHCHGFGRARHSTQERKKRRNHFHHQWCWEPYNQ